MQPTVSFKLAFLRHMLVGLRHGGVSTTGMSILERKKAIKSTADMAMALARGGRRWSRALIADLSGQEKNMTLAKCILGEQFDRLISRPRPACKTSSSKKILGRSFRVRSKIRKRPPAPRRAASASLLARKMVRKRTQVLKRLVPGGQSLENESSLLEETLDYVVFLRAQVDLMQRLTNAFELSKCRGSHPAFDFPEKGLSPGVRSPGEGETLKA